MATHQHARRGIWRTTRLGAVVALLLALPGCSGQPVDQSPPPPFPPPGPPPPLPPPPGNVSAVVTIDTTRTHQVMTGWEAVATVGQTDFDATPWADEVVERAVNELGINRLRLEVRSGAEHTADNFTLWRNGQMTDAEWRAIRYRTVNDNANPLVANLAGFHFSGLDRAMDRVVMPMRQRLAARGEALFLNLNYVAFSPGAGYVHLDPAEYAEFMLVMFQHLQSKYGVVPDAVEIILEPDNSTPWRGNHIGAAIVATAARLGAAGFQPEFIAPSTTSMANAVPFLDQIVAVPGAAARLREISYHRYGGVSDANLALIASRGAQLGLRTAMLEHIGSGVEDLYKDLTLANASAWQQFVLAFPTSDNGAQYYVISNGRPVLASRSRDLLQYFRYVRLGARRVDAVSGTGSVRPVGFVNVGGGPVVVLHASRAETYAVRGLRPGPYTVTASSPAGSVVGQGTATAAGELRFAAPAGGVLTVAWDG